MVTRRRNPRSRNISIGFASILALWNASEVLTKVRHIQKQAESISFAVERLNDQSQKLSDAINLLHNQVKEAPPSRVSRV